MNFMVETWDPSYGVPAEVSSQDAASESVDLTVEYERNAWKPLSFGNASSQNVQLPKTVVFVDGVRRFDAHMWFENAGVSHRGICATVAAGAVRCTADAANVEIFHVERGIHTCAELLDPIRLLSLGEVYKVKPTKDDSSESLNFSVQNHMARIEDLISESYVEEELVIFDGPLHQREAFSAVGYVKTQHVQYLSGEPLRCLYALGQGDRTPLFKIEGRFDRWSFYLRLPCILGAAASALVRLEFPGVLPFEQAQVRADMVAVCLPKYVSEPFKESRAPQNLYPISGLERQLRRCLGNRDLLERGLRLASLS